MHLHSRDNGQMMDKSSKKLSHYSKQELINLRERNLQMLSQQSVIDTLPDKGIKLKEVTELIENLLYRNYNQEGDITVENTNGLDCPLVKKLNDMTVLTPHQGARKRSVDLANQQAYSHYSSTRLLSKPKSKHHYQAPYPTIFKTSIQTQQSNLSDQAKVKMLTLEESMYLQKEQQSSVQHCEESFDVNHPSKSLLKSLNLSSDVIQDVNTSDPELTFNEEEDEEDNQVEDMMID